ncbi:hypothetical protein BDR22DRAFT_901016 [Usnea florida]
MRVELKKKKKKKKKEDRGIGEWEQTRATCDHKEPLRLSGVLNQFKYFDTTPTIGTEFPETKLVDWINAPNSDQLIRDLAIKVSERGVVFFRAQNSLDVELQKVLAQRLGELSGKPKASTLHIHPSQPYANHLIFHANKRPDTKKEWHSDITFEQVPCDYTILRMSTIPSSGGDTLWASGYEVYDRFSEPYQKFFKTLTCTFAQPQFNAIAAKGGFPLFEGPRGAPENIGSDLSAIHLVKTPNDVAIWDNRSTYHTATHDFKGLGLGPRAGQRATSLGERPYFDPLSQSWRE